MQEQCMSLWDQAATAGLLSIRSSAQSLQDIKVSRYPCPSVAKCFSCLRKTLHLFLYSPSLSFLSALLSTCLQVDVHLSRRFISFIKLLPTAPKAELILLNNRQVSDSLHTRIKYSFTFTNRWIKATGICLLISFRLKKVESFVCICVYLWYEAVQLSDSVSVRWMCGQPLR